MPPSSLPALEAILPEAILACGAMALLLYGVFREGGSGRAFTSLSVLVLAAACIAVAFAPPGRTTVFGTQFVVDEFGRFMKTLVLVGSAFAVVMSHGYNEREKIARVEYPVLILFAALGMSMMISANDLLSLYVGLELQSLALYVVAAFRRDSTRSSEAGLKYFVLGALSSGMLLYGCSLVYGFSGTTGFDSLADLLADPATPVGIGLVTGMVFVVAGLAFKISAVPFHMWTPDVYEGAPTPVTAFLAAAPKVAAVALLARVLIGPFGDLAAQWQQIVVLVSILSMALAAFAAIRQNNIKRLLAYSSIGHVGYALVGLAAGSEAGVQGVIVYMAIYLAMNIGAFCCVLGMRRRGRMVEGVDDLSGLSRTNPAMALALAAFMFSMAGIPPLAGFFGKLYVFLAAIDAGLYLLAIVAVLSSVVAAFYYLRIVKLMYFDEPVDSFERPIGGEMRAILAMTVLFVLFFFAVPGPVVDSAAAAAGALFAG